MLNFFIKTILFEFQRKKFKIKYFQLSTDGITVVFSFTVTINSRYADI